MIGVGNEQFNADPPPVPHLYDLEGPDRQGPTAPSTAPRPPSEVLANPPHTPHPNTPGREWLEGPDRQGPAAPTSVPRPPPAGTPQSFFEVAPPKSAPLKTAPAKKAAAAQPFGRPPKPETQVRSAPTSQQILQRQDAKLSSASPESSNPLEPTASLPTHGQGSQTGAASIPASTLTEQGTSPGATNSGWASRFPSDLFEKLEDVTTPKETLLGAPISAKGLAWHRMRRIMKSQNKGFAEDKLPLLFRPALKMPPRPGEGPYPEMDRQDAMGRMMQRFGIGPPPTA